MELKAYDDITSRGHPQGVLWTRTAHQPRTPQPVGNEAATDEATGARTKKRSPVVRYLSILGPGLVTGASDDDPSGIATYAQAGATYSNSMLWTVPLTLPLMMAVQEICDRTALATGKSLGLLVRVKFGRQPRIVIGVLIAALLVANTLNIAADLVAIGDGVQLLGAGPAPLWSAIAGAAIGTTLIVGSFEAIARIFKYLCLALLAYVAVLFAANVNWPDALQGMLGLQLRFEPGYLVLAVAVLGTTISPYLFFWQSAHRIEEMRGEELGGDDAPSHRDRGKPGAKRKQRNSRVDVFSGMAFSVLVMFAIIAATAATLGIHGTRITSAADAAKALQPIAGGASTLLFAAGFIGSGILAVPVLAASGSAGMAGLLGKNWGLQRSLKNAPLFYSLLAAGTILGILLSVLVTDPFALLVLSAIVNGIAAGPFLIVTMLIARDRKLMGEYRNGKLAATLGWGTTGLMCIAGAIGLWLTITGA